MAKPTKQKDGLTPVRRQYLSLKSKHPNSILFFRLGDFYETFDEDAHIVSEVLDIVLTSRNVSKGARIPMAGIPHHAMENYLSRLIDKGHHVAICEQVGTTPVNGLMPREVVRIITPGTLVEPSLLSGEKNNYLVSVIMGEGKAGIAYVDITTGEFQVTEKADANLYGFVRSELARLKAAEILHVESVTIPNKGVDGFYTPWPGWRFEYARCEETLKNHFGVSSLAGFGIKDSPLAVQAAGAILQYIIQTQPNALKLLQNLRVYNTSEFMRLDTTTRRNLELTETMRDRKLQGSLLGIIDKTISPMGGRLIRNWIGKPLLDIKKIHFRLEGVNHFFEDGIRRADLRKGLKPIADLERLINRVLGENAIPRDLITLKSTLIHLPELLVFLQSDSSIFASLRKKYNLCNEVLNLLLQAISDDSPATLQKIGVINEGYSSELDELLTASKHARDWIKNLETVEKERLGIKSLKVGYNKVHGYFIELTKSVSNQAPEEYIRKQTLVNAERYITSEMKVYESLVLNAEEEIRAIESKLFKQVCGEISKHVDSILSTANVIAYLDVFSALAESATIEGFSYPEVVEDDVLEVIASRHPVVERSMPQGERFVPNDILLEDGERIRIITGPNMSGKSTYLRQIALIVLLAQMGSFVPAENAKIGLVDRIFTRIGAQDEIHAGKSTFMVEMVEMANIINHATNRSLLVLDEVGRGTSTYDGVSIAWASIEYLHNHEQLRPKTFFATHYHELTELSELLPGVRNYSVSVSDNGRDVVFLHKIVAGGADRSYGIYVGKLAGLPPKLVKRAEELLKQLEATSGSTSGLDLSKEAQISLFPESNPLMDDLNSIDINKLNPIDALNKIFEWQKKYISKLK
jgi:DNA mismatch repair protein MutS